jgi:hypothetical protein
MLFLAEYYNWIWLVLCTLAVWRLTTLICYDAGPLDMMVAIRRLAYHLRLKSLVECFDCAAIWISIIVVLLVYRLWWTSIILVLAIAGAASIIERIASGSSPEEATEEDED